MELLIVAIEDAGPELNGYPTCSCCGCWEWNPCVDPDFGVCWWGGYVTATEAPLCSRCVGIEEWAT